MNRVELILNTGKYLYSNAERAYKKGLRYRPIRFAYGDPDIYDRGLLQNFLVECFSVAAVTNYELEERLKRLAEDILRGEHQEQKEKGKENVSPKKLFTKEAKEIIPQYNYTGEEPPEGHLKTNFRTAVTSAYHGSLWKKYQESGVVALKYMTRNDDKVREDHQKLHGRIFLLTDPIWEKIYPPNGWNCRCYVKPIFRTDNERIQPVTERGSKREREIVEDAGVTKEFQRNTGISRSIFGKWLKEKLKDKDWKTITKNIRAELPKNLFETSNEYDELWGRIEASERTITVLRYIKYRNGAAEFTDRYSFADDKSLIKELRGKSNDIDELRKGVLIKIV